MDLTLLDRNMPHGEGVKALPAGHDPHNARAVRPGERRALPGEKIRYL